MNQPQTPTVGKITFGPTLDAAAHRRFLDEQRQKLPENNRARVEHLHLEPIPAGLKGRIIHAARRKNQGLVAWVVQALEDCCEASEADEAVLPASKPICGDANPEGYVCSLDPGHDGNHMAKLLGGNSTKIWPAQEASCSP